MFLFPPPQFNYFLSSFLNSLPLHNINLSPPPPHSFFPPSQFLVFSLLIVFIPSSFTILLCSLLHLLIYSIYFSIHKYIDLLSTLHRLHIDPTLTLYPPHIDPSSTLHRPHINPTSTLDSTFFQHSLVNSETVYNHHDISIVFPSSTTTTTTTTTFLLFFPPPPPPSPHCYCFSFSMYKYEERISFAQRFSFSLMYSNTQFRTKHSLNLGLKQ